jgi:hypothetical protein
MPETSLGIGGTSSEQNRQAFFSSGIYIPVEEERK